MQAQIGNGFNVPGLWCAVETRSFNEEMKKASQMYLTITYSRHTTSGGDRASWSLLEAKGGEFVQRFAPKSFN